MGVFILCVISYHLPCGCDVKGSAYQEQQVGSYPLEVGLYARNPRRLDCKGVLALLLLVYEKRTQTVLSNAPFF